jgi:hypothetical protein
MVSGDVGVTVPINGYSLIRIIAVSRSAIALHPKDVSIRRVLYGCNVIIRALFDALAGNINISRRVQCKPVGIIVVICGAVIPSHP